MGASRCEPAAVGLWACSDFGPDRTDEVLEVTEAIPLDPCPLVRMDEPSIPPDGEHRKGFAPLHSEMV